MIDFKDISVVVQGAIIPNATRKCLNSLRKYLPGSEIILSTWKESNTSGLDYDILVENDDPGAVLWDYYSHKIYNNSNRQLVSTQNGLKKVNRKYALKLRTDFYLTGNQFLEHFDKFPVSDPKWLCFNHRVITCSVYTKIFSDFTMLPTPFHLSDFFFFGETEDIRSYFMNTPLMLDSEAANYECIDKSKMPYQGMTFRYAAEQYYCWNFVKQKFSDIKFDDWTDWNDTNVMQAYKFLLNNFIFLGAKESGIYSDKDKFTHALNHDNEVPGLMTYDLFKSEYNQIKRALN